MPTTTLCSLSCLSAHVHERISMDSYRFISREAITACCPQCGMHLKSMGLELYSQHSFQQGESSKTPTVCPLKTCPSVPQQSALGLHILSTSPFSQAPLQKGGTTSAQDEAPIVGGMQITLLNVERDFLSTSIYHPGARECCGFITMSLVL